MHYGGLHGYQKEFNGIKFLASYMQNDEKLKEKLYSINTIYMEGNSYDYGEGHPTSFHSINDNLKNILNDSKYNGKDVLIKLNGESSPFKKKVSATAFAFEDSQPTNEEKFKNNKGVTTDYYQSIIVISKPTAVEWNLEKLIQK